MCSVLSICAASGPLSLRTENLSRCLSIWLGTSANLHPFLLHLLHLTMCCFAENSSLPLPSHHTDSFFWARISLFHLLAISFILFLRWLFCSRPIAFVKVLLGTCLRCSWTLHPLLSLRHFSPCSSIHTLRNQSVLITRYIYRGFRAAVLKEKLWRNSDFKGGLILLDQFGLRTLE